MVKVSLPSPACAREVLCAAAGLLFAVLAPCSCPHSPSFLALFPPPRLGRYVVLHFYPPPRFHTCGHGLLRRYQPCAGRSLVFISFLFSTRARQIRSPPPPPRTSLVFKFQCRWATVGTRLAYISSYLLREATPFIFVSEGYKYSAAAADKDSAASENGPFKV